MRKSTHWPWPNGILSTKALADKQISDAEFTIITREVEKYHQLKKEIRDGAKKSTKEAVTQAVTQTPDLDKLTQERIHKEVEQEIKKS